MWSKYLTVREFENKDDFWAEFMEPSLGDSLRINLVIVLLDACERKNVYILYPIVCVSDTMIQSIRCKKYLKGLAKANNEIKEALRINLELMEEPMQVFFIKFFDTARDSAKDRLREYFKG